MSISALGWGSFGAAFPELVRQYDLRGQRTSVPFGYYVRSALFILGSGIVVMALPGDLSPIAAVYAGVAAPTIVNQGAQRVMRPASGHDGDDAPADPSVDDIGETDSAAADIFVEVRPSVFAHINGWRRFFYSL